MCGHVFMYHNRDALQRHRPTWQCGTCGRVSSVPLDCCTRPNFTRQRPPGVAHLLSEWVHRCGRWTLAGVRLMWSWQRHLAIRPGTIRATASPPDIVTAGAMIPTAEGDESPEGENVVVAAGEHR
jgi:hypothetical protein